MKHLDGQNYVEIKDKRYKIHSTEKLKLQKINPPTSPRTQYQIPNETQIKKNQEVIKIDNDELIVKNYPKNKQPIQQQQSKFKPRNCPSCKRNIGLEFDKEYYCKSCDYIINKQKHQIDKKVLRQDQIF